MAPTKSYTGHHEILAASKHVDFVGTRSTKQLSVWTFGGGTVIWRIWPAVLLFTIFSTAIIAISQETDFDMGIPPVMLTVLGVIIGFVISYRASNGFDRYWLGRGQWSDVIKNCRALGRLVWYHVPLRVEGTKKADEEIELSVLEEKRIALSLIVGFAIALKHHLRGEPGVYYTDLYHLVHPVHSHTSSLLAPIHKSAANGHSAPPSPSHPDTHLPSTDPTTPPATLKNRHSAKRPQPDAAHPTEHASEHEEEFEPVGLLPASNPPDQASKISTSLLPFSSIATAFSAPAPPTTRPPTPLPASAPPEAHHEAGLKRALEKLEKRKKRMSENAKYRPHVAGEGENTPLEVIRCLSEWVAVLEDRNTVNGCALGMIHGCLYGFEASLNDSEKLLTTPLPFIYSVHIRTVWLYLFFLPFQLSVSFGYYGIIGTAAAAFFFLGFLAAGEEIEQPFGYDDNDLDLDLFCEEIIKVDMDVLLRTSTPYSVPYLHSTSGGAVVDTAKEVTEKKEREKAKQAQKLTVHSEGHTSQTKLVDV